MFDVSKGRTLWERSWPDKNASLFRNCFICDSHRVLHASTEPRRLEILEPETGEPAQVLLAEFLWTQRNEAGHFIAFGGAWQQSKLLAEIPWLSDWLAKILGHRDYAVSVVDLAKGQEQFRLMRSQILDFSISENGDTLVTREPRAIDDGVAHDIHVWDVHPQRAWFWAVISSLSLGIIFLLLRRWRLKRKAAA
jgi:hypothetical protein